MLEVWQDLWWGKYVKYEAVSDENILLSLRIGLMLPNVVKYEHVSTEFGYTFVSEGSLKAQNELLL